MAESERTRQEERVEPSIDWERVRLSGEEADRRAEATQRSRRWFGWIAITVALLAMVLVAFRQPLANLIWPDTRIQQLLDQGDAALRAGRLSVTDGTGARQYFEAAQALDSDRTEAREGLVRVGQAALARAKTSTEQGQLERARADLVLASELQVPRTQTAAVEARVRQLASTDERIGPWLAQAQQAQAGERLDGAPDSALPLYQRILEVQPNHLPALEGREDALTDLLQQAQALLAKGELAQGGAIIHRVREYDAGHVDLPAAQAALARAVEARLARADRDRSRARLDAAEQGYQAVLQIEPEDTRARQGIERVAAAHPQPARSAAADFRFDSARASLERARALAPQSPEVADTELALQRAQRTQAGAGKPQSPRQREAQVQRLLDGMAQAEARQQWLTPPGESAYDQLRAAQAIAPDDPRVRRAGARLLPSVQQCFEQEWRANRVRRAQGCLSAWQTLSPRDAALPQARQRMAQKWIAVGDERLGAGDVAFAAQALAEARALQPAAPGLEDFAERVRLARASAP